MVSSQISRFGFLNKQSITPLQIPHAVPEDLVEFDFSDVFGPLPQQSSVEVDGLSSDPTSDINGSIYDNPEVLHHRSHSLVGPTCVKLTNLTIHKEDALRLLEDESGESEVKTERSSSEFSEESLTENVEGVGLEDFEVLKLVGQGAFGKVFQVRKKGTSEIYAMKVMRKDKIMEKNHAEYMKAERDILTKIDHPFIVQLRYSFQTKYRLYLVLDFVNGGHLFFQLYRHVMFSEDLARIYGAEIVSAVSHLHSNGIMHRDLKPENILLDADGHAMLTDFGLAKECEENTRSNSMCGTVEYMAPEIVRGKGHDKAADWWSVGILLFEMLTGKPPFCGNRDKIQQKIIKEKIKLPGYLSSDAHSLLKGLLQKEPEKRLASGQIKGHRWFKSVNWKRLEAREIVPGFRPNVSSNLCVANFDERWTSASLVDSPVASPVAGSGNFSGFTYVRPLSLLSRPPTAQ